MTDDIPRIMDVLATSNGAIIGSTAQWLALPDAIKALIDQPKDLNVVMEYDGTNALGQVLQCIRFTLTEDIKKDLQVGHQYAHFYNTMNKLEVTIVILDHRCSFNQYLTTKVHSGLINAIIFHVI